MGEAKAMSAVADVKSALQSTDDLDLVAAVRAGDDRAFELLFMRYEARIAAYVRGMVRDHGRAEDVTQEVFIAALRRMRETDRPIAFKPWIYEIAKNACIDAFRRTRNQNEVSFDADDPLKPADQRRLTAPGAEPDDVVDTKLALDDLCGAFGGLSPAHHQILVLREFEGLSYREIGDRLGISRAAVESTLFRARRRLGEEYEEIVSGKRCNRVRGIVDGSTGRAGLRDRRRMARHIAHCQPCRRYAVHAGIDVRAVRAPETKVAKVAALLPLPAFLRRRPEIDDAGGLLGNHASALHMASVLDPAMVSSWSKAVATAATVAVAGLGTGAAVGDRDALRDFASRAPAIAGVMADRSAAQARAEARQSAARVTLLRRQAADVAIVSAAGERVVRIPASAAAATARRQSVPAASTATQPPDGTPAPGAARRPGATHAKSGLPVLSLGTSSAAPAFAQPPKRPVSDLIESAGGTVEVALPGIVDGVGEVLHGGGPTDASDAVIGGPANGGQPPALDNVPIVGGVLQGAGAGAR